MVGAVFLQTTPDTHPGPPKGREWGKRLGHCFTNHPCPSFMYHDICHDSTIRNKFLIILAAPKIEKGGKVCGWGRFSTNHPYPSFEKGGDEVSPLMYNKPPLPLLWKRRGGTNRPIRAGH